MMAIHDNTHLNDARPWRTFVARLAVAGSCWQFSWRGNVRHGTRTLGVSSMHAQVVDSNGDIYRYSLGYGTTVLYEPRRRSALSWSPA